jgi:type IV secretory pathway TrbL component
VAHDKHVLSLKDNDQSANLAALVDAGIRSFKIEGRYKDMATVKNVTAHYRQLLDALLERRPTWPPASSGRCATPSRPTPSAASTAAAPTTSSTAARRHRRLRHAQARRHAGGPRAARRRRPLRRRGHDAATALNNGDALTWWDLQGELQGVPVNVAAPLGGAAGGSHPMRRWRR